MSDNNHEMLCFDSLHDLLFFVDDFEGDKLKDEWARSGIGAGTVVVVDSENGGVIRITTGGVLNNTQRIAWGEFHTLLVSKKASMETRIKLLDITTVQVTLRLYMDANNFIHFLYASAISANWRIQTRSLGVGVAVDSGIAADTDDHIFRIECHTHDENHVHFYIDDVETDNSPSNTNITASYLEPIIGNLTRVGVARAFDVDYVVVRQER